MLDSTKFEELKKRFEAFRKSEKYEKRKKQAAFVPLARAIIVETLKNENLTNEHLSNFQKMFKPGCTVDMFSRSLTQNSLNEQLKNELVQKFKNLSNGQKGFTDPNRFDIQIRNPTADELLKIKNLLQRAVEIQSSRDAKEVAFQLEDLKISKFTKNIYSPWLHYLNPQLFPIVNAPNDKFRAWINCAKSYADCISDYQQIKNLVGEDDLSVTI